MILIDANILMYAAGADHPYRLPSIRLLELVALGSVDGALDAVVLQEILHRYRAIGRWEQGIQVYRSARRAIALVFPVTVEVMDRACELLAIEGSCSARNAVHAAVVTLERLDGICSFDRGLDSIPDVRRLEPAFFIA